MRTRQLAVDLGFVPVVPPLKMRLDPWEYDRDMYRPRNHRNHYSALAPGIRGQLLARLSQFTIVPPAKSSMAMLGVPPVTPTYPPLALFGHVAMFQVPTIRPLR
jgi:hypothetical protein